MKKIMMNTIVTMPALAAMLLVGCQSKKPAEPITELPPEEPIAEQTTEVKEAEEVVKEQKEIAPSTPVVEAAEITTLYTIRKNDTISGVAARYGLRWQDVMAINPGINPVRLRIGQSIRLPGKIDLSAPVKQPATTKSQVKSAQIQSSVSTAVGPTTTYVVRKGDVLSAIALRYGVKVAAIRAANPKLKGDLIYVGQKLQIPAGNVKVNKKLPAKTQAVKKPAVKEEVKAVVPAVVEPDKEEVKAVVPAVVEPVKEEVKEAVVPEAVEPVKEEVKTVAPAVAAPAAQASDLPTYTVKEGEDVFAVAIRWGVSANAIKELNNLTSNELKEGQVLRLPAESQQ